MVGAGFSPRGNRIFSAEGIPFKGCVPSGVVETTVGRKLTDCVGQRAAVCHVRETHRVTSGASDLLWVGVPDRIFYLSSLAPTTTTACRDFSKR